MTSDPDDALTWEGDDDQPANPAAKTPALPDGWNAVGKNSELVGLSTPMLLLVGVIGGVYLLYTVGWMIGGLNLQASAMFLVPGVMYQVAVWAAVLTPALWFAAVWFLTRRSAAWVRVVGFIAGALLLVPWPFVMTGMVGA